jgi:hypothetical protein
MKGIGDIHTEEEFRGEPGKIVDSIAVTMYATCKGTITLHLQIHIWVLYL